MLHRHSRGLGDPRIQWRPTEIGGKEKNKHSRKRLHAGRGPP